MVTNVIDNVIPLVHDDGSSLLHLFSNWSFNNVFHKLVFVCLWTPWKTIIYLVNINFRSHLQITVWWCSVVNSLI